MPDLVLGGWGNSIAIRRFRLVTNAGAAPGEVGPGRT